MAVRELPQVLSLMWEKTEIQYKKSVLPKTLLVNFFSLWQTHYMIYWSHQMPAHWNIYPIISPGLTQILLLAPSILYILRRKNYKSCKTETNSGIPCYYQNDNTTFWSTPVVYSFPHWTMSLLSLSFITGVWSLRHFLLYFMLIYALDLTLQKDIPKILKFGNMIWRVHTKKSYRW